MNKEDLVQWLMSKDENVLGVAIVYAENYLKYGVDVTEKMKNATEMCELLDRARIVGYMERMEYEHKNSEQDLHRRPFRRDHRVGEGEPEVPEP